MPPSRPRGGHDDSRSEIPSIKDRASAIGLISSTTKSRRNGTSTVAVGSSLKDVVPDHDGATMAATGAGGQDNAGGIAWSTLDTSVLHSYRHAYRLATPSAFGSPLNQVVLTNPGIGRHSPTMARRKDKRRINKEQLALSVRKNFNGLGIQEGEVVVDFLYKVRWQDKNFRLRFAPTRTR